MEEEYLGSIKRLIFSKNTCCLGDVYPISIIIEIIKQYEIMKSDINDERFIKIIDEIIKNIISWDI